MVVVVAVVFMVLVSVINNNGGRSLTVQGTARALVAACAWRA